MNIYDYKIYTKTGRVDVRAHSLFEDDGTLLARINVEDDKWVAVAGFAKGEWTYFTCEVAK